MFAWILLGLHWKHFCFCGLAVGILNFLSHRILDPVIKLSKQFYRSNCFSAKIPCGYCDLMPANFVTHLL